MSNNDRSKPVILVTGRDGQVGWELRRALCVAGEVVALGRDSLNLTNPDNIRAKIREIRPDIIVNAAAYTSVDLAEKERDIAMAVNGAAPGIMAEEAKKTGALMIHYSTDYVFDGKKTTPYTEYDEVNPQGVYGESKLAGEKAVVESGARHLIFRTSWVYGARGKNFLLTIRRLARERDELRIVDDQIGAPTWSRTIAEATAQIVAREQFGENASGIYHMTCEGEVSWAGFAEEILALDNMQRRPGLTRITTADYPTPAKRPAYSVLSGDRLQSVFGVFMPQWDEALRLCLEA